MRFDLPKALARRIANGDLTIDRDGPDYFLRYDRLEVALDRKGKVVVSLFAGNVCIAYMDADRFDLMPGSTLTILDLQGRMQVNTGSNALFQERFSI